MSANDDKSINLTIKEAMTLYSMGMVLIVHDGKVWRICDQSALSANGEDEDYEYKRNA